MSTGPMHASDIMLLPQVIDASSIRPAAFEKDRYSGKTVVLPNNDTLAISVVTGIAEKFDCQLKTVHCVPREYPELQAAADIVKPGDTVIAEPGSHSSFIIERTGTLSAPIKFVALPGAIINRYPDVDHGIVIRSNFSEGFYVDYLHIIGFSIVEPKKRCLYFTRAISNRPSKGHIISDNNCFKSGEHGFYFSQVSNTLISHNLVVNSGEGPQLHGMYFANGGSGNNVVFANIIIGSENNGIHCNGDRFVDFMEDESRGGSRGTDGIVSGMIFDSNIILYSGQSGVNLDGAQDLLFSNNVIYGSSRHAIRGYAIDGSAGPANIEFVNNTFSKNNSAVKLTDTVRGSSFILLNNLFVDHSEDEIVIDGDFQEAASLIQDDIEFVKNDLEYDGNQRKVLFSDFDFHVKARFEALVITRGLEKLGRTIAVNYDLYGRKRATGADIGAVGQSW